MAVGEKVVVGGGSTGRMADAKGSTGGAGGADGRAPVVSGVGLTGAGMKGIWVNGDMPTGCCWAPMMRRTSESATSCRTRLTTSGGVLGWEEERCGKRVGLPSEREPDVPNGAWFDANFAF
jgi:hypothetical protein